MTIGATQSLSQGSNLTTHAVAETAASSAEPNPVISQPGSSGEVRSDVERPPHRERESNEETRDSREIRMAEERARPRERYTPRRTTTRGGNDSMGRLLDIRA